MKPAFTDVFFCCKSRAKPERIPLSLTSKSAAVRWSMKIRRLPWQAKPPKKIEQCSKPQLVDDYRGQYYPILERF